MNRPLLRQEHTRGAFDDQEVRRARHLVVIPRLARHHDRQEPISASRRTTSTSSTTASLVTTTTDRPSTYPRRAAAATGPGRCRRWWTGRPPAWWPGRSRAYSAGSPSTVTPRTSTRSSPLEGWFVDHRCLPSSRRSELTTVGLRRWARSNRRSTSASRRAVTAWARTSPTTMMVSRTTTTSSPTSSSVIGRPRVRRTTAAPAHCPAPAAGRARRTRGRSRHQDQHGGHDTVAAGVRRPQRGVRGTGSDRERRQREPEVYGNVQPRRLRLVAGEAAARVQVAPDQAASQEAGKPDVRESDHHSGQPAVDDHGRRAGRNLGSGHELHPPAACGKPGAARCLDRAVGGDHLAHAGDEQEAAHPRGREPSART